CAVCFFFFSSRRRHTRFSRDWSSDVCSSDLDGDEAAVDAIRFLLDVHSGLRYSRLCTSAGSLTGTRALPRSKKAPKATVVPPTAASAARSQTFGTGPWPSRDGATSQKTST